MNKKQTEILIKASQEIAETGIENLNKIAKKIDLSPAMLRYFYAGFCAGDNKNLDKNLELNALKIDYENEKLYSRFLKRKLQKIEILHDIFVQQHKNILNK